MPRYEYRVWATQLDDLAGRIAGPGKSGGIRQSQETYVSAPSVAVNPKIRAGVLDVKVLIDVVDGFEQWMPQLKAGFPVSADLVVQQLFPILELAPPAMDREQYTSSEFVSGVVGACPELKPIEVLKHRSSYLLGACLAEIADVVLAGRRMQTVALESEDLGALKATAERVGLLDLDNRSYPAIIRDTTGKAAT